MTPFQFETLHETRERALKAASYFGKPCYLWECAEGCYGGRYTFRIGVTEPPRQGARMIEKTRMGIRFRLNSGAVFRVGICQRLAECSSQ